jgi:hypothetical protein
MPLSSAIIFMAMVLGFWVGLDMDPITWPKSREGNLSVTSSQSHKLDPRGRKVKILATLGPASANPEMIRKLIRAGADAFRVNMSHADHATHEKTIAYVREAEKEIGQPISILCDLQGRNCAWAPSRKAARSSAIRATSRWTAIRAGR